LTTHDPAAPFDRSTWNRLMASISLDEVKLSSASWRRMLAATPIPNQAARVATERADLLVTVPMRAPEGRIKPLTWVLRPRKERTVRLDALGREVWSLCDGQRTVEGIVDAFANHHQLTFHESRVSVTEYLKLLVQRGALAVALAKEPEPASPADAEDADP